MNYTLPRTVISLGGSLIVPESGIDTHFLTQFNNFIRHELTKNPKQQFILVVGGGATARNYRDAGKEVIGHELTTDDMDWLGIHATRLNAHLIRTIFRDLAHKVIIEHYDIIRKAEEPIVVASGWKPGHSTDYCAVMLAHDYQAKTILNLSNISQVCDSDPKNNPNAKPLSQMSWTEFRKLVGDEWSPGLHAPFDPIASKHAEELGLEVVVMSGSDFVNLKHYFNKEPFIGTTIK